MSCPLARSMQVSTISARPATSSRCTSLVASGRKQRKRTDVVLMQDHEHLGNQGDICTVALGHMTNWLVPKGIASQIAAKRAEEEAAIQAIKDEAQALATALQTLGAIKIAKKVGEQDKIFGTVKTSEIVEYVQKQTGRTLDVGDIDMPDISRLGTYEGTVKLHPEVTGIFTVKVVKQPE